MAQIAEESGVTLDDVVEKLAAAMKKKLSELVEADKLDPDQARRLMEEAVKRLTQSLREFRQDTIDKAKTNDRPAWASSARLYKDRVKSRFSHRISFEVLATSKSGTHWEPRDQGLDGGLVSSLRALL